MANADLQWGEWRRLDPPRQEFIISQLGRYFLSPLLYLDATEPVSVSYFGHHLQTYDLLLSGEWLRFIPGMRGVTLGADAKQLREQADLLAALGLSPSAVFERLSPRVTVDMPPLLVARSAVASGEAVIGQLDMTTHVFKGDQFAYQRVQAAVLATLETPVADPLAPTGLSPVLTGDGVTLRQVAPQLYQVSVARDWDVVGLQRHLSGFGFTLPNEREYEYLMSGGLAQLFPWGNRLPDPLPRYLPNRFGLTVPLERTGPELTLDQPAKSAPVPATASGAELLALSPFYRGAKQPFATSRYRKIVRIALD